MRIWLASLCVFLTVGGAEATRWTGTQEGGGQVVVRGRISADGRGITGRWRCRGAGCLKKRGRFRVLCQFGSITGRVGAGPGRCQLFSGPCVPGFLRLDTNLGCLRSGRNADVSLRQ
jgi:hypothetical protein